MGWNGSGTFNRIYSWVADKAAGLDIIASRMDTDTNDIASNGFGNCLTRDGQGQPTANLPMNNFRHTGAGNGIARTDYAVLGQAQDGLIGWTIAGGTADAITATYTPAGTALVDGLLRSFRSTAANATTTPTFAPDGQAAHTITRAGGAAIQPGDIPGALAESWARYNLANTRWELLNPAQPGFGTGSMSFPNGTTGQRPGSPTAGVARFNSTTIAWEGWDGSAWRNFNAPNGGNPSITSELSGSGNYATPANALYLVAVIQGSGGGGGGSGAAATAGGGGNPSSFNGVSAAGGGGGSASTTTNGGAGGSGGTGGSGGGSLRFLGAGGQPGSTSAAGMGGAGAVSQFAGAGQAGSPTVNATAAQANTGSGGGGGGAASGSFGGGGGGGAGEICTVIVSNPSGNYAFLVGAAGSAGTGTAVGAAGGSGIVIVTAYFQ